MNRYLTLLFLLLTITVYGQHVKKKLVYRLIKTFYIDLNNDGKMDTVSISSSLKDSTYKGCFNKIAVKLAGFKKQTFIAKEYWTNFDKAFLDSNKNSIKSALVFIKRTEKHATILLWGNTDGAGEGIEFSIINIENNHVKMVFNHSNDNIDVEIPIKLTSLENNGRLDFIYRKYFQFDRILKNGNVGSYNPFYVYTVDDSCALNKPLMKAYNQKNYVFAGYEYSEKIDIYYPNNKGKPTIWKKRRVQE